MRQPPRAACRLLLFAAPTADGEAIAGDLCEEFHAHVLPARGPARARGWFYWQVARSLAPLVFRSWQRASLARATAAAGGAAIVAALPASAMIIVRSFVLSQVPLKTTSEVSPAFAVTLGAVVVVTAALAMALAVRVLAGRR